MAAAPSGIHALTGLFFYIQDQLAPSEVDDIRSLLLAKQITKRKEGTLDSAMKIFQHLEERRYISEHDISLLLELLGTIGRVQLQEHVRCEFQKISKQRSNNDQPGIGAKADVVVKNRRNQGPDDMYQNIRMEILEEARKVFELKKDIIMSRDPQAEHWLKLLTNAFNDHRAVLLECDEGCLLFILSYLSVKCMEYFWKRYKSGDVEETLTGILLSPEIQSMAEKAGFTVRIVLKIDEKEFNELKQTMDAKSGHTVFMKSRSQGLVGREEEVAQISKYVESSTSDVPLVVLGEAGTGKSAMVAYIANRYLQQNKKYKVFYHFVGATPGSTNLHGLLSRVWFELMHHSDPVPVNLDKLIRSMTNVYSKANDWALGAEKTVLLLIDALNQLESDGEADKLEWLPRRLPPRMRVIVSTLEGPYLEALRSRREKPQEVQLGPLASKFRKDIVSPPNNLSGLLQQGSQGSTEQISAKSDTCPSKPIPAALPYGLCQKICLLMDSKHPTGNDWRMLAEKIGLDMPAIQVLEENKAKKSPSGELLSIWQSERSGTKMKHFHELRDIFVNIHRDDVATVISEFIEDFEKNGLEAADQAIAPRTNSQKVLFDINDKEKHLLQAEEEDQSKENITKSICQLHSNDKLTDDDDEGLENSSQVRREKNCRQLQSKNSFPEEKSALKSSKEAGNEENASGLYRNNDVESAGLGVIKWDSGFYSGPN